jgi:UDP-N-acetylglucosamine--N-acetylmuramyl-(pentapeptide) pyrophosphoryl-undecaprenol N-acetylglucosamine transferase
MISTLDRAALRDEARRFFGLDPDRPTLVVPAVAGRAPSQPGGLGAAAALADAGVQVLHVVGPQGEASPAPTGRPYVVVPFVDRMDLAYAAADLVSAARRATA